MKYMMLVVALVANVARADGDGAANQCEQIKDGIWVVESGVADQGNTPACKQVPKKIGVYVHNGAVTVSTTDKLNGLKLTCFTMPNGCRVFASCAVPMTEKGAYSVSWIINLNADGTPKSGLRQEGGTGQYCSGRAITGKFVKSNKLPQE